jgi:agmatine deiminase
MFPLQFNYIPYPLWRRRGWFHKLTNPLWGAWYPVEEDRQPPTDSAAMADYLVRYGLLPAYGLSEIRDMLEASTTQVEHTPDRPLPKQAALPARLPAQWEPMEAVIVNWPILYPPLWDLHAQMVEAIAPVADVLVTVPAPMWAHAASVYLRERSQLCDDSVRFLVVPTDDIWVRDYGPIVGYDADGERVAFDAIYDHIPHYPQTRDDAMPQFWSAHMGMPVQSLKLHTEGGNLWTDGEGTLIMTRRIFEENPSYDRPALEAYLHQFFAFEKLIITPRLRIESTGHVDLLVKLANAETILVSAPTTRSTAAELREAAAIFRQQTNAHGARYHVLELPTPPLYFNWFAYPIRRSYTNALTVNGRVLVPVYGLKTDAQALRIYEQAMPDYEIIPIDCKIGANGGGAVHCMTKEVPRS